MDHGLIPMNCRELQAARKLLMLDVSEAAEEIGKVSARTWQYWESGRSAVPLDVSIEIETLLESRLEKMGEIDDKLQEIKNTEESILSLRYFLSFDEYLAENPGGSRVMWRIGQSIAALYYTEGLARLS